MDHYLARQSGQALDAKRRGNFAPAIYGRARTVEMSGHDMRGCAEIDDYCERKAAERRKRDLTRTRSFATPWLDCQSPPSMSSEGITRWRDIIRSEKRMTPRKDWESDVDRMVSITDGVGLTVRVLRKQEFLRRRKPWRYGRIDPTGWHGVDQSEHFFARFSGKDCTAYSRGETQYFALEWEASNVSPPDILPTFLGLYVINPVSREWRPVPAG